MRFAYGVQRLQLDGMPSWAATERYDITAKADGDPPPIVPGTGTDPMTLMLRSLLVERFRLVARTETREMPIYALVRLRQDRLGARLEPSTVDCGRLAAERTAAERAGGAAPAPPPPDANGRPTCFRAIAGDLDARGVPMAMVAQQLQGYVNEPIVDRTALDGFFDFDLRWRPDTAPDPQAVIDPDAPSIFTALREQLGLRLVPARVGVDVHAIVDARRPDPN